MFSAACQLAYTLVVSSRLQCQRCSTTVFTFSMSGGLPYRLYFYVTRKAPFACHATVCEYSSL